MPGIYRVHSVGARSGYPRVSIHAASAMLIIACLIVPVLAQPGTVQRKGVDGMQQITVKQMATTTHTHVCLDGTITYRKREADGDWHLKVEDGGAWIVVEVIPQIPLVAPKVKSRVHVCGITRFDKAHKWYEIHPVLILRVLP